MKLRMDDNNTAWIGWVVALLTFGTLLAIFGCASPAEPTRTDRGQILHVEVYDRGSWAEFVPVPGADNRAYFWLNDAYGTAAYYTEAIADDDTTRVYTPLTTQFGGFLHIQLALVEGNRIVEIAADTIIGE